MPLHAALSLALEALALEALAAMPAGTNREDRAAATRTLTAARDAEVERVRSAPKESDAVP